MGANHFLFFSSAGFTVQADAWATGVGMALFRFAFDGAIEPTNEPAEKLFTGI